MTETQATVEAPKAQIREIIEDTAVGYHDKVYVNVTDGRLRFLAGSPGATVVAYTDFTEGEIESIEVHTSPEDGNAPEAQAVIPVPALLDYLDLASGGSSGVIELELVGSEDVALAEQLRLSSTGSHSFEVGLTLPASESALESVPDALPEMFNNDNVLINRDEERQVTTHIETYIDALNHIVEVVSLREEMDYHPVVVREGDFVLEAGSEQSNYVNASLQGDVTITTPDDSDFDGDVDNLYGDGFESIVNALEGQVTLHVEQDAPLLILKEQSYGTLRHVIGPAQ